MSLELDPDIRTDQPVAIGSPRMATAAATRSTTGGADLADYAGALLRALARDEALRRWAPGLTEAGQATWQRFRGSLSSADLGLGDAGAFAHVARAGTADLRDPIRLAPIGEPRARTDAVATGSRRGNATALAGRGRDIPVLATQLRAAAATIATNAACLAAFAHDAELPALLGASGYESPRPMRDDLGVDLCVLGLERTAR